MLGDSPADLRSLTREHGAAALQSAGFGRTTLGMRSLDVLRGIDCLQDKGLLARAKLVVVGEGAGGLWAAIAAINDSRVSGVVTIGTLPSYKLLTHARYYEVAGYFDVPGALRDFDVPDLARLAAPKPQVWVAPVNALGRELDHVHATTLLGSHANLHVLTAGSPVSADVVRQFAAVFHRSVPRK